MERNSTCFRERLKINVNFRATKKNSKNNLRSQRMTHLFFSHIQPKLRYTFICFVLYQMKFHFFLP